MTSPQDIKKLITHNQRRLQKLKEQKSIKGISTPPDVLTEIEDIEAELGQLRGQLEAEQTRLHQRRDSLTAMAEEGLSVDKALVEVQQQLTDLKKQLTDLDKSIIATGGSVLVAGNIEGDVLINSSKSGNVTSQRDMNIGGDIVTGSKIEQQTIYQQTTPGPTSDNLQEAYLHHLFESSSRLSLAGVDPKAASSEAEARLNLGSVYTALLTLSPEHHEQWVRGELPSQEMRRLSALEQLNRHPRLVLLGDPGSGKSTFVNFVAMCLAGEAVGQETANLSRLTTPLPDDKGQDQQERQSWEHKSLLPVRVILRDFAARGLPAAGQKATGHQLWKFIVTELEKAGLKEYTPHLRQQLMEQGGLLLLDGLDEVPEANHRREQLKDVVENFAAVYPHCRIMVTSRTYAYQKQAWRLPGFTEAVLAPFSQGQVRRFVDGWYKHIADLRGLDTGDAQGRAEILKRAIFSGERLQALAERPLLLTLMASLHAWRGGSLPEKREELYADTVDLLLDWWESPKTVRDEQGQVVVLQPSLAEWLKVDRDKVRALLNELAYQAHQSQPELVGTADVDEGQLVSGLMRLSQNPDVNPARLVEYLSQRAGLLLPRGVGVYTFPHRTFQEYLAACYLTDDDYPDKIAELARNEPERWREVALLAGAKAAWGSASTIWQLVEALCYRETDAETCTAADVWGAHLAGQALVETAKLEPISERNEKKVERVKKWLVEILVESKLPATERVAAGVNLAQLGDDRPGAGLRVDGLPDIVWCKVAAGPFLMGDEKREETLPAYKISQYPITNAQYQAFVKDEGYGETWRKCWTEAGWKWKGGRREPRTYGGVFDLANHPVVMVTWYEAIAFCNWLTVRLRENSELTDEQEITLPSEAHWEKTARGTDGRIYPWGDEADPNKANYKDTGIGTTSAVGCFAGGASPYGVQDMSGNVYEWTSDIRKGGWVWVRGGAYYSSPKNARASYRFNLRPDYFNYYFGFRILVAPVF